MRKVKVNTRPVANSYAANNEKIIEFSHEQGGGLISFQVTEHGQIIVDVYQTDPAVVVRTSGR